MVEFETLHTAEGLKRVYTEWWERRYRSTYRIAFGCIVIAFASMLLLGSAPWPLVVVATLATAYSAFLTTVRDTAVRLALENLRILGPGPLRYRATDAGLHETSAIGECELRWIAFDSVVRQSDALLLVRTPKEAQAFIVFPLAQIPPELPGIFEAHIQAPMETRPSAATR